MQLHHALQAFLFLRLNSILGMDLDLGRLKRGVENCPNGIGLFGDISINSLPENSVDVLVSTNTLYKLSVEKRYEAIENFCKWMKPDGKFFCQMPNDEYVSGYLSILSQYFNDINYIYYGNAFSIFYERLWDKTGDLSNWPRIGRMKYFQYISYIIGKLENLTLTNSNNAKIYFRCSKKKSQHSQIAYNFNLNKMSEILPNIFKLN